MLRVSFYLIGFWPPLSMAGACNFDNTEVNKKLYFFFNVLILLTSFTSGLEKNMNKATRLSGIMDLSNPCRWRAGRLHHQGDSVCDFLVCFVWSCEL
jgi:hypothetical protein